MRCPAGIQRDIDQVIVPPGLGTRSGVLGTMALAIAAEHQGVTHDSR